MQHTFLLESSWSTTLSLDQWLTNHFSVKHRSKADIDLCPSDRMSPTSRVFSFISGCLLCFAQCWLVFVFWKCDHSSLFREVTYGICVLIEKSLVMSDSWKFIKRTLLISSKCPFFFPVYLNCKSQLNYVLWGVNFWHHMSLRII